MWGHSVITALFLLLCCISVESLTPDPGDLKVITLRVEWIKNLRVYHQDELAYPEDDPPELPRIRPFSMQQTLNIYVELSKTTKDIYSIIHLAPEDSTVHGVSVPMYQYKDKTLLAELTHSSIFWTESLELRSVKCDLVLLLWSSDMKVSRKVIGKIHVDYFDTQQYNDLLEDSVEYYTTLPAFGIPAPPSNRDSMRELELLAFLVGLVPLSFFVWYKLLRCIVKPPGQQKTAGSSDLSIKDGSSPLFVHSTSQFLSLAALSLVPGILATVSLAKLLTESGV